METSPPGIESIDRRHEHLRPAAATVAATIRTEWFATEPGEPEMTIVKSMLVGIGLSLALATAASAQSMTPEVTDGIAKVVPGNASPGYLGDYAAETRATGHRILMKHGPRLKAG